MNDEERLENLGWGRDGGNGKDGEERGEFGESGLREWRYFVLGDHSRSHLRSHLLHQLDGRNRVRNLLQRGQRLGIIQLDLSREDLGGRERIEVAGLESRSKGRVEGESRIGRCKEQGSARSSTREVMTYGRALRWLRLGSRGEL